MIPRIIHYCWFGNQKLPEIYIKYMDSWKKFCPGFEIIEWNERNFDISSNSFCYEAYTAKKWAFVSDYARLKIIYENGGIYLDTDVELIKPLEPLMRDAKAWIGFQNKEQVNTGLGFAAEQHNNCIGEMLKLYNNRHFRKANGDFDLLPCPVINTVALKKFGLNTGKSNCNYIQHLKDIDVYPICTFNPMNSNTKKLKITESTYSIHHYSASWINPKRKKIQLIKRIIPNMLLEYRTDYKARRDIYKFIKEYNKTER